MNNRMTLRLALLAAAAALPSAAMAGNKVAASTPNSWAAASAPVISTLTNGPWTLGAYNAPNNLLTSPPAQTDYCLNGTINTAANPTPTIMAPFYFPQIVGQGQNLFGYFNYRPNGQNEITVAAKTTDGGKSWTWLDQALQISTACPTTNATDGNDTGLGHPYLMNLAGANYLYLLDRRKGHVDVDGLTVHRITPQVAAPLHANPALDTTAVATGPANNTGIIVGWDFTQYTVSKTTAVNTPAPSLGTVSKGSALSLGMTNSYYCSATPNTKATTTTPNAPALAPGFGSTTFDDIVADAGSSVSTTNTWRVRGQGGTTLTTSPCNGWDLDAPQYTQGAQFNADTTGVAKVLLEYDWYSTNQGFRDMQVQYSLNVKAGSPVWTNIGPVQIAVPSGYLNQLTVDFSNVTGAGNNPNFGVRFVGVYDPTLVAGSYTDGVTAAANGVVTSTTTVNYANGGAYSGATTVNGLPQIYNDNSGNWRFANVKFFDATKFSQSSGTTPTDYATETTGLLNPDGILAVIPNTYPRKVLYVQKQLNASLAANTCPAPLPPGNTVNSDIDTIRLASTTDGVHFTDLGATNLLDPTTTSNLGIRYAAPNGSVVKFASGKFGLFFGAGNCEDGDSDGFHAIVYAENTDSTYLNWTYVNNMNNPIAEISYSAATPTVPPLAGVSSEVNGGQNYWFGGRTYNPNAIYQGPNTISLIFAGYNYGYFSGDDSNYRTISQMTLTSSQTLIP